MDNGQGMDLLLQDQSDQGPEAGFPAVEAGSDVRDHLLAAAFPQAFHLADEIPFLVMGRDPCVSDVTPSRTRSPGAAFELIPSMPAEGADCGLDETGFLLYACSCSGTLHIVWQQGRLGIMS